MEFGEEILDALAAVIEDSSHVGADIQRMYDASEDAEGECVAYDVGHSCPVAVALERVRMVPEPVGA